MLATPTLLPSLLPWLLDKLSSKQVSTKVECLSIIGKIAQTFTLDQLIDKSSQTSMLDQVLSQVSHVFFNVIDDQIQEKAAWTISMTLNRLLSVSGTFSAEKGITFVAGSAAAKS